MKILNITPKELSHILKYKKEIGHGSYGIIVKLNNDELFKFNYKDFVNDFWKKTILLIKNILEIYLKN